jgi:hypothetical protein
MFSPRTYRHLERELYRNGSVGILMHCTFPLEIFSDSTVAIVVAMSWLMGTWQTTPSSWHCSIQKYPKTAHRENFAWTGSQDEKVRLKRLIR